MFLNILRRISFAVLFVASAVASNAARDYFTEQFNGDFDLSYSTFTFKPDRSSNGYAVCKLPATEFPTPPTNGYIAMEFNDYPVSIYAGPGLPFYGEIYQSAAVNPNGSVTYESGDSRLDSSVSNHFRLPRVSAWLGTLGTQYAHPVRLQNLPDRIVLTWVNQPEWPGGGSNNLQLELFYDGVIRLTFLRMDASNGLVGLSRGNGVPADFSESDLSNVGCTGQALYEMVWSTPAANALVGQSFAVTLSGRDAFNLNFPVNGPARLGAGRPGDVIFRTDFEQGTAGFTFSNISSYSNWWHLSTYRGTQIGHSPSHSMYFGAADLSEADAESSGAFGKIVSPLIDLREVYPPVTLSLSHVNNYGNGGIDVEVIGKTNLVAATFCAPYCSASPGDTSNRWLRLTSDLSSFTGQQIRLHFSASISPDYPRVPYQNKAWLIDDIVITGTSNSIPVTPPITGTFTGNSWAGNLSVGAPGSGIVLIATHSNGVYGLSAPFNVSGNDDLILTAASKKTNAIIGTTNSIDIVVSNTGPNNASSVIVTNQLPPGITLGNVAVSQGSFSVVGNRLLLNFGTLGGSAYALASFEFTPTAAGSLAFTSTVGRAGSETFFENNRSVNTVNVGEPVVNVAATIASEGATNMVFALQLDAPSPLSVSVRYATISASAVAGEDFVATNGFITFPPNTTNAEVRVTLIDDSIFEVRPFAPWISVEDPPEYFTLQLTSAANATVGFSVAPGTIQENEPTPTLLVITTNVPEGDFGTNLVPLLFRLTGPAARSVDVQYNTESGVEFHQERGGYTLFGTAFEFQTPYDSMDFVTIPSTTIHFAPGETQRVVYVQVIGDSRIEPDEFLTVAAVSNYLTPRPQGAPRPPRITFREMVIVDDDPAAFSVDDYRVLAENCGATNGVLDPGETVTLLLRLRNIGYNACTSSNLTATLLTGGGVQNPSGPQNYAVMCGGGPEVWRPFTFTVGAACGNFITATLAFSDNGTNLGIASIPVPVGVRGHALSEDFESVTPPALPPDWASVFGGGFSWVSAFEAPANTNQIVRLNAGGSENALNLQSAPFAITSSNAWVKIRHRFEMTPGFAVGSLSLGSNAFLLNGYNQPPSWTGSSRGWMNTMAQLPASYAGTTQSLVFSAYFPRATALMWEIDSVEVFDGPAACCDSAAPAFTSVRRTDNNIVLQWRSISNRSYQIQFRPSLDAADPWLDSGPPIMGSGPLTARTNTLSSSNGFYRVRLNP